MMPHPHQLPSQQELLRASLPGREDGALSTLAVQLQDSATGRKLVPDSIRQKYEALRSGAEGPRWVLNLLEFSSAGLDEDDAAANAAGTGQHPTVSTDLGLSLVAFRHSAYHGMEERDKAQFFLRKLAGDKTVIELVAKAAGSGSPICFFEGFSLQDPVVTAFLSLSDKTGVFGWEDHVYVDFSAPLYVASQSEVETILKQVFDLACELARKWTDSTGSVQGFPTALHALLQRTPGVTGLQSRLASLCQQISQDAGLESAGVVMMHIIAVLLRSQVLVVGPAAGLNSIQHPDVKAMVSALYSNLQSSNWRRQSWDCPAVTASHNHMRTVKLIGAGIRAYLAGLSGTQPSASSASSSSAVAPRSPRPPPLMTSAMGGVSFTADEVQSLRALISPHKRPRVSFEDSVSGGATGTGPTGSSRSPRSRGASPGRQPGSSSS